MKTNNNDTIAAISTSLAPAGLGVIRISGKDAISITDCVFQSINGKKMRDINGYSALYGHVFDKDGDIDEAVALKFSAPHSYTGEDVVEISCHGGIYILKRVLNSICDNGARMATAGEFTRRAFENGKLDLTAAESVMDLISAEGRQSHFAALSGHNGALFHDICKIKNVLLGCSAALSAWVDFPDDEIPDTDESTLKNQLCDLSMQLTTLIENSHKGKLLREGIDTVIAGKPNVGKSTLMNLLLGEERSIVTDMAGTTRDIVEEKVRIGDIILRLSDTAGLRNTDDPIEQIGVSLATKKINSAALILAVFDLSRPLDSDDLRLLDWIKDKPAIAIFNKSDISPKFDSLQISTQIDHCVTISAAKGQGISELESEILTVTGLNRLDSSESILANDRQRNCAVRAKIAIDDAVNSINFGFTLDAVGVCIDEAIAAICEMTGERVSETIIEEIFSRFCVGK